MRISRATRNGWIMLGVAALLMGGFAVAHIVLPKPREADTLCIPGGERGQTLILVDKTDKWNADQSDRLQQHILDILNHEMKQEERLRVFAFGASFSRGFKENFTACKPPDGRNCKGVFCNPKQLREQYESRFLSPLVAELQTLKIATAGNCSPIAEVLVEVMARKEIRSRPGPTRIVLISDMAQNTQTYTAFSRPYWCPGISRADPERDTGLVDFFRRHTGIVRLSGATIAVFQVLPEGRQHDVAVRARRKWEEVFQVLEVRQDDVKWNLL